jgi:hypothetical protein
MEHSLSYLGSNTRWNMLARICLYSNISARRCVERSIGYMVDTRLHSRTTANTLRIKYYSRSSAPALVLAKLRFDKPEQIWRFIDIYMEVFHGRYRQGEIMSRPSATMLRPRAAVMLSFCARHSCPRVEQRDAGLLCLARYLSDASML